MFAAGVGTGIAATAAALSLLLGLSPAPPPPRSAPPEPPGEESRSAPPESAPAKEREGGEEPEPGQEQEADLLGILPKIALGVGIMMTGLVLWYLFAQGLRTVPGPQWHLPGGDTDQGRQAILRYGCGSCHTVPGIRGATGRVGPQLTDFKEQTFIGGQIPNTPSNLVQWIRDPQRFAPGTAMPDLGVTEAEARDIAAYLYAASRK